MLTSYSILRPGGNNTGLVVGVENDPIKRKEINDAIMVKHPNVEQVGFVNLDPNDAELMMAGGEFCGNATRSTAWLALKGKPGEILIKVSGVGSRLKAGVDEQGNAWAQMPIYPKLSSISFPDRDIALIEMEGITHIVMDDIYPDATEEEFKSVAMQILQRFGLDKSVSASGVMFLTRTEQGVSLRPVVWVRDIKTLFYETACGSGTAAIGLLEAFNQRESINLPVTQPTGMQINIMIDFDGNQFNDAVISGPVEVLNLKIVGI